MKIAVAVKQVATLNDEYELPAGDGAVEASDLDWSLNKWDEYSLEAALQLRDAATGEVVAVTVGGAESDEALLACLARGADRAVRIDDGGRVRQDPLMVARALAGLLANESPDLILCGVQSSDGRSGATGAAVAGLLDLPRVAVVRALHHDPSSGALEVTRELEGGLRERLSLAPPALLTLQTGINRPRYANLRAIKLARSKPRTVVSLEELGVEGVDGTGGARIRRLLAPEAGRRAEMIEGSATEIAARISELVARQIRT
jgi:electron transfer flavoprotein beta subunit